MGLQENMFECIVVIDCIVNGASKESEESFKAKKIHATRDAFAYIPVSRLTRLRNFSD